MAKRVVLPMLALSVRPACQAWLASYKATVIKADPVFATGTTGGSISGSCLSGPRRAV